MNSIGLPHSDISGSMDVCSSPKLFAAYHVFHRLPVPRHSPCALSCLTFLQHKLAFVSVLKTIALVLGMIIYSEIKCWLLYYILFFNKFLDFIDSCLSCIQFSRCIRLFEPVVEITRFELVTSCMPCKRSPSWANRPNMVTRMGFEPMKPPWKGGVLTTWPTRHCNGGSPEIRTRDTLIKSQVLCQLS